MSTCVCVKTADTLSSVKAISPENLPRNLAINARTRIWCNLNVASDYFFHDFRSCWPLCRIPNTRRHQLNSKMQRRFENALWTPFLSMTPRRAGYATFPPNHPPRVDYKKLYTSKHITSSVFTCFPLSLCPKSSSMPPRTELKQNQMDDPTVLLRLSSTTISTVVALQAAAVR